MLAAALALLLQDPGFPEPPFVRERTLCRDWMGEPIIVGDVAYFQANETVQAFDLRQWKELWTWEPKGEDGPDEIAVAGDKVYVATSKFQESNVSRLVAIDRASGVEAWSLPRSGPVSPIVVEGTTLYTAMEAETVSAIDLRSRSRLWTAGLKLPTSEGEERASAEALSRVGGGHIFVATYDNHTLSINVATGRVDWSVGGTYSFGGTPTVADGVVVFTTSDGIEGRDAATGRSLWTGEEMTPWFSTMLGSNLVLLADDVVAVAPKTGRVVWRIPLSSGEQIGGWNQGAVQKGDRALLNTNYGVLLIDKDGKVLWRLPQEPGFAQPVWADGNKLVAFDRGKLMLYERGSLPPLPTDRAERTKLAAKLVGEFETLDYAEIARIKELGDDAFVPVLTEFLKRAQRYEDVPEADENSAVKYPLYDVASDISDVLEAIFVPSRTKLVIERTNALPTGHMARQVLTDLVSSKGEGGASIEFLMASLKGVDIESEEIPQEAWTAIMAAAQSSEPAAVDFMIAALKNDKANERIRQYAYWNLARTGGEKGLAAVLAARTPRRLLAPMLDRMGLEELNDPDVRWRATELYGKRTDAAGRTWALVRNGALANRNDLWLLEESGGKWVRALFTGAYLPSDRFGREEAKDEKFYGKTAKELTDGAWYDVFVGNPDLERDTDRDGLTDLMEARLGTDAKKSDTDGDGDNDLVDPWPDTALRKLTDTESVLAATFEARYKFDGFSEPAIFSNDEIASPFEMPGRFGPVLWKKKDELGGRLSSLADCYENGVAMISFHEPWEPGEASPRSGQTVVWNADKTEATVMISTYWGGLAGDGTFSRVRKFGEAWVVVEMQVRYVS